MMLLTEYFVSAITCILLGFLILITQRRKSKNKALPGPPALPIIGNVLQIGKQPHIQFTQWARKYGPICRIKMGTETAVIITDHKLLKELFSDTACAGRPMNNPAIYEFARGPNGIVNSEGPSFEKQKRFALKTLKDFGFSNKTSMECLILEEVQAMIQWFRQKGSTPISGNRIFNAPVVNSLWCIITGQRCEWEVARPKILDAATQFWESLMEITASGIMFAPVLRKIAPSYLGWYRYLDGVNAMFQLINDSVQHHKETFDPSNLRDFIDHYLLEMERTTDPTSSFYKEAGDKNLIAVVFDLFIAGSETTSNTLSWALLYICNHPEVQKTLHSEIDTVLCSRSPSLQHRPKMPYTEAVIAETLRVSNVVSLGSPHRMTTDKMFQGYLLSEGSTVFGNYYGIHSNPDIWGDPENFRPERFLNAEGTSFVRHEALLPFSEGKRKCLGDTMAKDTLFLFISSIFQQFQVLPANVNTKGEVIGGADFEPEQGYFLVPKTFTITMIPRA